MDVQYQAQAEERKPFRRIVLDSLDGPAERPNRRSHSRVASWLQKLDPYSYWPWNYSNSNTATSNIVSGTGADVPQIPGAWGQPYWAVVNRDAAKAVNILRGYDGGHFIVPSEKPGGATYRLFFSEDRLIRLEYERPRFEK